MEVIILAGGFGTRLKSVVNDVPKPMAEVNGRPFLDYIFDYLIEYNVNHIILSVGYKQEVIKDYFGSSYKGVSVSYSSEDAPLFTGGAIKQALTFADEEEVVILNGDTFFNIDLNSFKNDFKTDSKIAIAVKEMTDIERYGSVELSDDGKVLNFIEKQYFAKAYINGGVYIVRKDIFKDHDEIKFSFENYLENNLNILNATAHAFNDSYFIDIGIPDDYAKVQIDFNSRKALFLDRDGIINIDNGYVHKKEDFVFNAKIFDICKFFQDKCYKIFIVTNQAGIARGLYTEADLKVLNEWMTAEFEKSGVTIDEVFYCPHHPEKGNGEYTIKCDCRKPETGMILKAHFKYNVNLKESVLIGDKLSDIKAGKNAGIGKNYLIKSQYQDECDFEDLDSLYEYLADGKEL